MTSDSKAKTEGASPDPLLITDSAEFELFAQSLPVFVYQLLVRPDGSCTYLYASENARKIFGLDPAEFKDDAFVLFRHIHPDDYERVMRESEETQNTQSIWHSEFRMILPDGRTVWVEGHDVPRLLPDGNCLFTGYTNDITARKQVEEGLQRMAHFDPLTGLANRAYFFERLERAIEHSEIQGDSLALLFVDLDHFKPINDQHGHGVGDLLLTHVAERLLNLLPRAALAGRIGGDEFVVMLSRLPDRQTVHAEARELAESLRQSIAEPFEVDGLLLEVSASIGIALCPEHQEAALALTKAADQAMYHSKQAGGNCLSLWSPGQPHSAARYG